MVWLLSQFLQCWCAAKKVLPQLHDLACTFTFKPWQHSWYHLSSFPLSSVWDAPPPLARCEKTSRFWGTICLLLKNSYNFFLGPVSNSNCDRYTVHFNFIKFSYAWMTDGCQTNWNLVLIYIRQGQWYPPFCHISPHIFPFIPKYMQGYKRLCNTNSLRRNTAQMLWKYTYICELTFEFKIKKFLLSVSFTMLHRSHVLVKWL